MSFLTDFIRLAALVISLSFIYGIHQRHLSRYSHRIKELFTGILFSLIAIASMLSPIVMLPGIIIDARIITIVYAAVFGGIPASLIVTASCLLTRILLGGEGIFAGAASIVMAFLLGILIRNIYLRRKKKKKPHFFVLFAAAGLFSTHIYLISMIFLPGELILSDLIKSASVPLTLIFTVIGWFAGVLILREEDRYQIEQKLKQENERKTKALAVANDGYFEWDYKSGKFYLDSNYYRMIGYEPGEFEGSVEEWRSRIHQDDLPVVDRGLLDFSSGLDQEFDMIYRFRKKDGSWLWIHARAVVTGRDDRGDVLRVLGTHSDISAYKDAQHELKQFLSAIEHAAEAILISDSEGMIEYVNPAFCVMTGYSREEVIGRKTNLLKSGEQDNEFYRDLWDVIKGGQSWSGQMKNRRKDGSLYTEESVISPVISEDNSSIINFVSIKKDISGDLDLQEQIEQSRKMQAIGQLAGGVAHDFNNMLTGIMTASMMLRKKIPGDDLAERYLSIIDEAVQRSAELTRNLLSFSRKQPQLLNIISLHDSIRRTEKLLRSTLDKSIQLNIDLCDGEDAIVGDTSRIENAVLNLCINASHAIDSDSGVITVKTEVVTFDKKRCEKDPFDLEPGDYIHLSVRDNGSGIDQDHLGKIFEPFFTTKQKTKGTGLGLTAVYTMVQQHKGSISVESAPGKGTVFHLYFYLVGKKAESHFVPDTYLSSRGEGTILLVDDEELIRKPVMDMLTDAGFHVYVAQDGREALDVFSEHSRTIDLVILDVVMPGMDGLNCLIGLRKIKPAIPVIVETGFTAEEKINRMREIGIQGFIRKPAGEKEIRQVIDDVLSATIDA
ncbi:PAS domain-containing protein [Spirochaeta isovalerica]|uniref:histidine kinase n=1 Tax=Spirochaeta isovalerica TaxID=150 RepID=A0A841RH25_9SPIO|nr:PAS domain-containing protein [Spirochaeta isovalerica]MBB6481818.1 PAS domain S-box-containing protein [Spirochaeta isovalerica]